jgi:hypothetical protein
MDFGGLEVHTLIHLPEAKLLEILKKKCCNIFEKCWNIFNLIVMKQTDGL